MRSTVKATVYYCGVNKWCYHQALVQYMEISTEHTLYLTTLVDFFLWEKIILTETSMKHYSVNTKFTCFSVFSLSDSQNA